MPANVGEMFYYGTVPWHGKGKKAARPLMVHEALQLGGLEWKVGSEAIETATEPPSPVRRRQAIVRLDRKPGDSDYVLGVNHLGFRPIQNADAAEIFDGIFGHGEPVYHTGGYLGSGEVIWLLAKLPGEISINDDDPIEPYALMVNSHDGSKAYSICLTTIRVVCQNTLNIAIVNAKVKGHFKRSHSGPLKDHQAAAEAFWRSTMEQLNQVQTSFRRLVATPCSSETFTGLLDAVAPLPAKRPPGQASKRQAADYERRLHIQQATRGEIERLRESGPGSQLETAHGTLWGALNAVTAFVDHESKLTGIEASLLGQGNVMKGKAYHFLLSRADPSTSA